jgi:hypothetical protein
VGFGLPTGFVSEAATPHLAGVQCESCHGPAGNHAANPEDFSVRPRVEIAATVCGGCHTDSHQPTFEEWSMTGHAGVVEDMSPAGRINSCGRCHSATARFTLLNGGNPLTVTNDANVGIVCVTCHDPHANHVWTNVLHGVITNFLNNIPIVFTNNKVGPVYTNQLRNPVASTNDYFLTTGEAFTNKYNANINTCAQCHNHRGAVWTSSARAPHHSPQYNMLLGTVGELPAGTPRRHRATHALMEKQCAGCHMQTTAHMNGPPEVAADTGHKFAVDKFEACAQCHVSAANGEASAVFWSGNIANQIQQVKSYLDFWAMTKAPASLWAAYGTRAWEYSTPGDLSPGGSSPNAVEQAQIPDNIKRARFNLYIVLYDGSHGIHNPVHTVALLEAATSWIQTELNN